MFEFATEAVNLINSNAIFQKIAIFFLSLISMILVNTGLYFLSFRLKGDMHFINKEFFDLIRKSLFVFIFLFGFSFIIEIPFLYFQGTYIDLIFYQFRELLFVVFLIHSIFKIVARFYSFLIYRVEAKEIDMKRENIDVAFAFIKIVVFFLTFIIVLHLFGIGLGAVLTFGGVGGIIIGFASKDLLANFFGSMMVYLDRPFVVGDFINCKDPDVIGYVEYIGWRVVQMKSLDNIPVYIPSAAFSKAVIENLSRRGFFRLYTEISVCYLGIDQKKLEKVTSNIMKFLSEHEMLDSNKTMTVNLSQLSENSAKILIYTFTKTTNFVNFCMIREEVYLNAVKNVKDCGMKLGRISYPKEKQD